MTSSELLTLLQQTISTSSFVRATFGGPRRGGPQSTWLRAIIRHIGDAWQIEQFEEKKSFARTVESRQIEAVLNDLFNLQFSAIYIATNTEEIDIRISKKGKISVSRQAVKRDARDLPHNRVKNLPLPEGEANDLFQAMGILDRDGHVRPTLRAKFTQVNEFLKHLLHVLDDAKLTDLGRPVEILDAGCGSSYLTLAVHYYLNRKRNLPANLIGVDVNEEVIRKSVTRAEMLGSDSLQFVCARIDALTVKPDVVIALHACDTATDAALAAAIRAEAKLILSVPCCHHHLNAQLKAANAEVLRPILRHGILHERQADLITDAFRALLLRIYGYRTEVVEFTSAEHTARNLMIRAVKVPNTNVASFVAEYEAMKAFFGVVPYLETLLPGTSILQASSL